MSEKDSGEAIAPPRCIVSARGRSFSLLQEKAINCSVFPVSYPGSPGPGQDIYCPVSGVRRKYRRWMPGPLAPGSWTTASQRTRWPERPGIQAHCC